MIYYALSDIHGYLDILKKTMEAVDLSDSENKIIFLGDYIDYGNNSCEVLYYIKELSEKYKNQVIVLRGNHEEMFLEWLANPIEAIHWLTQDKDFNTIKTFISKKQFNDINSKINENICSVSKQIANVVKKQHKELLLWLHKLPYYYQTEKQIFVHAGINEEAEDLWMHGTPQEYFTEKFPAQEGYFYKDIIAGHIGTYTIRKNNCHDIYFDGKSHYYIDGTTKESGIIPLLKYDTNTALYSSFYIIKNKIEWKEISSKL